MVDVHRPSSTPKAHRDQRSVDSSDAPHAHYSQSRLDPQPLQTGAQQERERTMSQAAQLDAMQRRAENAEYAARNAAEQLAAQRAAFEHELSAMSERHAAEMHAMARQYQQEVYRLQFIVRVFFLRSN